MQDLFVDDGKRLTAGKLNVLPLYMFAECYIFHFLAKLREFFHVQYSCKESPLRQVEEATYINFVDFVKKSKGRHTKQHEVVGDFY